MVEIKNISKKFKETLALNNVSMTINKGDIYGFVGENGAGKSTLIKIITNVINETSGEIEFNFDNKLGSISAIVEEPSLHMDLNAFNNLKFQNDLFNLNKTEDEIKELLTLVGLKEVIGSKKTARTFSLGMKQRLSIAMALITNPKLILLDEPMNGLDPVGIKDIRELILKLNQEYNITFLISSHILTELDKVATKYGFISKGELLKEITHKELHENSKNYLKVLFKDNLTKDDYALLSNYEFDKINEKEINIYGNLNNNLVFNDLINKGFSILNIEEVKVSIEDYYIEIIRGNV